MKKTIGVMPKVCAIALSAVMLLAAVCVPAYATETEDNKQLIEEAATLISGTDVVTYGDLKEASLNCDFSSLFDTSSFYNAVSSLDMTAFGKLSYDLPTSVKNTTMLNLEYYSLFSTLQKAGWGVETTLEIPNMSTGYASNITDRFAEIYGDMSDRANLSATMPIGWTMAEIMSQSAATRNEMSESIKNTEIYQNVLTNISAGNLFASANTTLKVPEMKSATELKTILSESAAGLAADWDQKKADGIAQIQKEAAKNSESVETVSKQDIQDLFDEACGKTDAWLDLTVSEYITDESKVTKAKLLQKTMDSLIQTMDKTVNDKYNDWVAENIDPTKQSIESAVNTVETTAEQSFTHNSDSNLPPMDDAYALIRDWLGW